ncbi:hypothetical protein RRG08_033536 [Elysia crispata]|uniref:Uncharacterized protein n=1 Tax=Elysia crispata TaxID=231223 RepID=A0AAE0XP32_9GAST|nr:hypothetical protein RRG08_033536 [Elysia crispata]
MRPVLKGSHWVDKSALHRRVRPGRRVETIIERLITRPTVIGALNDLASNKVVPGTRNPRAPYLWVRTRGHCPIYHHTMVQGERTQTVDEDSEWLSGLKGSAISHGAWEVRQTDIDWLTGVTREVLEWFEICPYFDWLEKTRGRHIENSQQERWYNIPEETLRWVTV